MEKLHALFAVWQLGEPCLSSDPYHVNVELYVTAPTLVALEASKATRNGVHCILAGAVRCSMCGNQDLRKVVPSATVNMEKVSTALESVVSPPVRVSQGVAQIDATTLDMHMGIAHKNGG